MMIFVILDEKVAASRKVNMGRAHTCILIEPKLSLAVGQSSGTFSNWYTVILDMCSSLHLPRHSELSSDHNRLLPVTNARAVFRVSFRCP
jgi:ABC-type uncharacterized transport system permease subunit